MISTQGSLTILNAHTDAPSVFWNGVYIEGVKRIHIQHDEDERRVKLVVRVNNPALFAEMSSAGVAVKVIS